MAAVIINKVETLDEEQLSSIGGQVVEAYEEDFRSRTDWDQNNAVFLKLFSGWIEGKSQQFLENSANVTLPLLSIACLQFQARAYDSLIPSGNIVRIIATDGASEESVERLQKHMNWQLRESIPGFEKGMDKLCLKLPIFGSGYKKTFYDQRRKIINSCVLGTDNFVIGYNNDEFEDIERKTEIIELTPNEVMIRIKNKIFSNVEKLYKNLDNEEKEINNGQIESNLQTELKQTNDQITGIAENFLISRPRIFLEQHCLLDLNNDGLGEPYVVTVDKETKSVVRIVSREYRDPLTKKTETWEYFTDYTFIPNPVSSCGYGFGLLLRHLNEISNSITNELLDAGNLANMQAGLLNTRSGLKKGTLSFKRGEFLPVDSKSSNLRDDIFTFDFKQPSPALFSLLSLFSDYSQKISSVSDAMIGKLPSSDTTATSFMAALEQGLKVFSNIHKRIHSSFKQDLKKQFLLNRLYLNEEEYYLIQDSTKISKKEKIGRRDYLNYFDAIPVSDPNILSNIEKVNKANMVYQLVTNEPLLANNQRIRLEAVKQVLTANDCLNITKYLPTEEELQPQEFDHIQENSRFIQELSSPVLQSQDHQIHIQSHQEFAQGEFGQSLTPQGKLILESHVKEHMANLYLLIQQQQSQQQGEVNGLVQMVQGEGNKEVF